MQEDENDRQESTHDTHEAVREDRVRHGIGRCTSGRVVGISSKPKTMIINLTAYTAQQRRSFGVLSAYRLSFVQFTDK